MPRTSTVSATRQCHPILGPGYRALCGLLVAGMFVLAVGTAVAVEPPAGAATAASAAGELDELFEKRVRPLLVERCQKCHGPDKMESGLRVDSRDGLLRGGDRGVAIVARDAAASLLIEAVRYTSDDLQMPPDGQLDAQQIHWLERWIELGAPWPDTAPPRAADHIAADNASTRSTHWALQPLRHSSPPAVQQRDWPNNELDRFVLAKLESQGLQPSAAADALTLVRRVYLDLIGLPPTYEQAQSYLADARPDAYEHLVDRLMASPQYAERWGRHWLDVARYADTKGYVDGGQTTYPFAYTYRNYVLQALAEDLPWDQFLLDQLAADLFPLADQDKWRLAGMGFLTVGRRFNDNQHDILDDRIDVVMRGLMGMTVSCARCHDHKYDPIPTADYYALHSILASSFEPTDAELPLLDASNEGPQGAATPELDEYRQQLGKKSQEYYERYTKLHQQIQHELRSLAADYLVYVVKSNPQHCEDGSNPLKTERTILRGPSAYGYGAFERWQRYLDSRRKDDPVWGLWRQLLPLPKQQFASARDAYLAQHAEVNSLVRQAVQAARPDSMVQLASCYGTLLERTYAEWTELQKTSPELEGFADAGREAVRQVLYAADSPATMSPEEAIDCYYLDEHVQLRSLRSEIEKVSVAFDHSPPRAMMLREREQPVMARILIRGQPNRPGREVRRQLPEFMAGWCDRQPVDSGSGRRELALGIVDRRNPLTYRVLVNRVWQWHFGAGLVTTPSEFGVRSEPPSHPELLDYLAASLLDHDASFKWLQRLIVTSRTYRQASRARPEAMAVDPSNRLLWRFAPRRVDWEVARDSILAAAQRLDTRYHGRAIAQPPDEPASTCRSLYLRVDRQDLSRLAMTFDFASPDFSVAARSQTTVPQQQLFFMNSPFVIAAAERIADDVLREDHGSETQRVSTLFRRVLGRDARDDELALADRYLADERRLSLSPDTATADPSAWQYGFGRYDQPSGRLVDFQPLPHFEGGAWQGGRAWPDETLHYLRITARGGHVGIDPAHAAVRRWVAADDGVLQIEGTLAHVPDEASCGDGLRGWIVSSRQGMLASYRAVAERVETRIADVSVVSGEILDFVVDCRDNHFCDLFEWAPRITERGREGVVHAWDAAADFSSEHPAARMSAWAKLAQILLESNERIVIE